MVVEIYFQVLQGKSVCLHLCEGAKNKVNVVNIMRTGKSERYEYPLYYSSNFLCRFSVLQNIELENIYNHLEFKTCACLLEVINFSFILIQFKIHT